MVPQRELSGMKEGRSLLGLLGPRGKFARGWLNSNVGWRNPNNQRNVPLHVAVYTAEPVAESGEQKSRGEGLGGSATAEERDNYHRDAYENARNHASGPRAAPPHTTPTFEP